MMNGTPHRSTCPDVIANASHGPKPFESADNPPTAIQTQNGKMAALAGIAEKRCGSKIATQAIRTNEFADILV